MIAAPQLEPASHRRPAATWSGNLLDEQNRGALVEPGTLVCLVGDPQKPSAVLLVDDTDVARLTPGQRVRLVLDQQPGQVLTGEVLDVARHDAESAESQVTPAPTWRHCSPASRRRAATKRTTRSASSSTCRPCAGDRRPRRSEDRRRADHAGPLAGPLFRPDVSVADVSHDLEGRAC